jgi:hypothetical protein
MSTLRTFHVDGIAHQVLFTVNTSVGRLCKPRPDHELEPVIVVRCELLDDRMRVVADGQAVCAEADTFDYHTGAELALDRMLADAECYVRGWWVDDSLAVLDAYYDATGTTDAPPLHEEDYDFWGDADAPSLDYEEFNQERSVPMNMFEASAVYKDVLRRQVERQVAETIVDVLTDTYIHPVAQ